MPRTLENLYSEIRPVLYGLGYRFNGKFWIYTPENPKELVKIHLGNLKWKLTSYCDNGSELPAGIWDDESGNYFEAGLNRLYSLAKLLGK
jgi:hypothetical protein